VWKSEKMTCPGKRRKGEKKKRKGEVKNRGNDDVLLVQHQ